MKSSVLLVLLGGTMIMLVLVRFSRRIMGRSKKVGKALDKERLKKREKDVEFGKDVKWSIGDDDK